VGTVREYGAALAVFELENGHQLVDEWNNDDWLFGGDIAVVLPKILSFVGIDFANSE
jgi:NAD-dependent deacetylase sirtuin 5